MCPTFCRRLTERVESASRSSFAVTLQISSELETLTASSQALENTLTASETPQKLSGLSVESGSDERYYIFDNFIAT